MKYTGKMPVNQYTSIWYNELACNRAFKNLMDEMDEIDKSLDKLENYGTESMQQNLTPKMLQEMANVGQKIQVLEWRTMNFYNRRKKWKHVTACINSL